MKSILLIDDDDTFRTRLLRAFTARGLKANGAASGKDAYRFLKTETPDAVVLDMKLEEESGLSILQELRARIPDLKVVILTGYGTIATTVDALKLGAHNYLTKPLDADTILAAFEDTSAPEISSEEPALPPLSQIEWDHIQRVLRDCDGNITKAAAVLGIHRRSLQRKLAKDPGKLQ